MRLSRRASYDAVHAHWPLPMGLPAAAGSRAARNTPRLIATFHGAEIAVARVHRCLRALLTGIVRALDASVANSSYTAAQVRDLTGVEPVVIPLGAPRGAVCSDASPDHSADDGLPIVLSVGRMIERKGFPVLVRAAKKLRGRARVVVVGDGEGRATVEAEIQRHNLGDVVRLAGRLPNTALAALYEICTVFCLPAVVDSRGYTETLGVVSIEAMSHGKPVVASRLGGVPDAVEHGRTGLLVSPGDPDALAEALLRVVGDPKLAARMGQAGRERAARLFSWESIARDHLALYGA
jgi:glycosyltransferase involved in cell wall biosynthesis